MSIAHTTELGWRLRSATEESPLAVFLVPGSTDQVNVVFASTVATAKRIKDKDPLLIGVFHKNWKWHFVQQLIEQAWYPLLPA